MSRFAGGQSDLMWSPHFRRLCPQMNAASSSQLPAYLWQQKCSVTIGWNKIESAGMHLVLRAFLISSTMLHVIAQRQGDMPSWWNLSPAIIARTHYPVASLMVFIIMCFDCIETETQLFRIRFEWLTDGFLILKSFILSLHKWVLFFSWSLAGRQHKSLGTVRTHTHTHTHTHTQEWWRERMAENVQESISVLCEVIWAAILNLWGITDKTVMFH